MPGATGIQQPNLNAFISFDVQSGISSVVIGAVGGREVRYGWIRNEEWRWISVKSSWQE